MANGTSSGGGWLPAAPHPHHLSVVQSSVTACHTTLPMTPAKPSVRIPHSARAASAPENALLVAVIATVIVAALVAFGGKFGPVFTKVGQEVTESSK